MKNIKNVETKYVKALKRRCLKKKTEMSPLRGLGGWAASPYYKDVVPTGLFKIQLIMELKNN